MLQPNLDVH